MNVLILGGGGREHALCHALHNSPDLQRLFVLPGNAGTGQLGINIAGDPADPALVLDIARRERVDLVIVGPEDPLAAGVADACLAAGVPVFGPTRAAAQLEANKAFAKNLMRQHAIPTAEARIFDSYDLARQYIATRDEPLVVKAAGLARGKGVIICRDPSDAILAAEQMLVNHSFGDAGRTIVVEELLNGREASLLAIVSGQTAYLLEPAQDYKRLRDNDEEPNTGGMGAFCPAALDDATMTQIQQQILIPTLNALTRDEIHYCGVLYLGLMLTVAGPKVLEYNCRFGDPEAQVVLPRVRGDLLAVLAAAARDELDRVQLDWDPRAAVTVVLAAPGYPEQPTTGRPIRGLPAAGELPDDQFVFHAGTTSHGRDTVTAGGRVLACTGLGPDLAAARDRAYALAEQIDFDGMQFRRDIAASAAT